MRLGGRLGGVGAGLTEPCETGGGAGDVAWCNCEGFGRGEAGM